MLESSRVMTLSNGCGLEGCLWALRLHTDIDQIIISFWAYSLGQRCIDPHLILDLSTGYKGTLDQEEDPTQLELF
jgi:hypothetical protein